MTEFGEATEIAKAAGAEPPVLELRADEIEAEGIARKGAFYYRARHGRAGEKRARELEEFADAAFAWQHGPDGSAPPPVLEGEDLSLVELERRVESVFADAIAEAERNVEPSGLISWLEELRDRIVGAELEGDGEGEALPALLEDEDLEELAAPGLDEEKIGPTARARRPITDRPQA